VTGLGEAPQRGLPYFGAPPARAPVPAEQVPALRGKRVVLSTPEGFVYDMRAASKLVRDDAGNAYVWVVSEVDWYRWMLTGEKPRFERYAARLVYAE
jgi:hypothetical protein